MKSLHTVEQKLKERIKELSCLYEVTSLIVNCDYDRVEVTLTGIVDCLKRAWQFNLDTYVILQTDSYAIQTEKEQDAYVYLQSPITIFNKEIGDIKIGYPYPKYTLDDFLEEEQQLLDNVCLEVGGLLERRQIRDNEAAIRRQVEQADRLRILGEITAGIAHELNTPLANILGFTELLKERVTADVQSSKDLDKIITNAIFSREVVKKLMFFACEMPQEKEIVNMVPIVEDAMDLMRVTLQKKNISCVFHKQASEIRLRIDKIQLTQVLFNLIVNAIYFSPEGGTIHISLEEKEGDIFLEIKDEGSGIEAANEKKIFDPFFTTKPHTDGSGLGLSVVHGIVQSHQGSISHTPNTPQGTIFTIRFPKS